MSFTEPNDSLSGPPHMDQGTRLWGMLRRRQVLVLTWRGWFALLLILGTLAWLAIREAHSFLAMTEPVSGGALVVEGWAPDYVLQEAVAEFERGSYEKLYGHRRPDRGGRPSGRVSNLCRARGGGPPEARSAGGGSPGRTGTAGAPGSNVCRHDYATSLVRTSWIDAREGAPRHPGSACAALPTSHAARARTALRSGRDSGSDPGVRHRTLVAVKRRRSRCHRGSARVRVRPVVCTRSRAWLLRVPGR